MQVRDLLPALCPRTVRFGNNQPVLFNLTVCVVTTQTDEIRREAVDGALEQYVGLAALQRGRAEAQRTRIP